VNTNCHVDKHNKNHDVSSHQSATKYRQTSLKENEKNMVINFILMRKLQEWDNIEAIPISIMAQA